jgi:hypothetical protein
MQAMMLHVPSSLLVHSSVLKPMKGSPVGIVHWSSVLKLTVTTTPETARMLVHDIKLKRRHAGAERAHRAL